MAAHGSREAGTLQELLAPPELVLFNRDWKFIGSKIDLATEIEQITGIPKLAMQYFRPANHRIAEKFSWSARRVTTREEDRAYCLLGLFEINMPLLYGEGTRAFQRLQEEIMRSSTDLTLFLWQGRACETFGMLAADPTCYSNIPAQARNTVKQGQISLRKGWSINNAGLNMEAEIQPYMLGRGAKDIFLVHLNDPYAMHPECFEIFVQKDNTDQGFVTFTRATVDGVAWRTDLTPSVGTYLAFGSEVVQLIMTRQRLAQVYTAGSSCGYTVFFEPQPQYASFLWKAFQRPAANPHAQLRDWHIVKEQSSQGPECSFTVDCRGATGLHGYLIISLAADVEILICLGLSRRSQPLSIIVPLCKQVCDEGLDSRGILDAYYWISKDAKEAHEIFDTELHMMCLCGSQQSLQCETDFGLTLDLTRLSDSEGYSVRHNANIRFNIRQFMDYHQPSSPHLIRIGSLARHDLALKKLREAESNMRTKRLESFNLLHKASRH